MVPKMRPVQLANGEQTREGPRLPPCSGAVGGRGVMSAHVPLRVLCFWGSPCTALGPGAAGAPAPFSGVPRGLAVQWRGRCGDRPF